MTTYSSTIHDSISPMTTYSIDSEIRKSLQEGLYQALAEGASDEIIQDFVDAGAIIPNWYVNKKNRMARKELAIKKEKLESWKKPSSKDWTMDVFNSFNFDPMLFVMISFFGFMGIMISSVHMQSADAQPTMTSSNDLIKNYRNCIKDEGDKAAKRWRAGEITSHQFANREWVKNCYFDSSIDYYAEVKNFDECEEVYNAIKHFPDQGYPCEKYRTSWGVDENDDVYGSGNDGYVCYYSRYSFCSDGRRIHSDW